MGLQAQPGLFFNFCFTSLTKQRLEVGMGEERRESPGALDTPETVEVCKQRMGAVSAS